VAILTLAEAKQALNIVDSDSDDVLTDILNATIEYLDDTCGPSVPTPTTDVVEGNRCIVLKTRPVISLTSVTGERIGALTVSDLRVSESGLIQAKYGTTAISPDWYTVVYSAGRATVPDGIKQAAKVIVRHMFQEFRGPTRRPGQGEDVTATGSGFAVPNRALEMMRPHMRRLRVA
jgi:hypothetical protein